PPGAGVGSAIGFLRAPFGYEAVRSAVYPLSDFNPDSANRLLAAMTEEAIAFVEGGFDGTPIIERTMFMRYAGQGWDIPVALTFDRFDAAGISVLKRAFAQAYERFFGRAIEGLDVEIVSWSVKASSPLPPVTRAAKVTAGKRAGTDIRRRLFDAA